MPAAVKSFLPFQGFFLKKTVSFMEFSLTIPRTGDILCAEKRPAAPQKQDRGDTLPEERRAPS